MCAQAISPSQRRVIPSRTPCYAQGNILRFGIAPQQTAPSKPTPPAATHLPSAAEYHTYDRYQAVSAEFSAACNRASHVRAVYRSVPPPTTSHSTIRITAPKKPLRTQRDPSTGPPDCATGRRDPLLRLRKDRDNIKTPVRQRSRHLTNELSPTNLIDSKLLAFSFFFHTCGQTTRSGFLAGSRTVTSKTTRM